MKTNQMQTQLNFWSITRVLFNNSDTAKENTGLTASHLAQDGKLAKAGAIHMEVLSGLALNHGNPLPFSLEERVHEKR